MFGNYFTVVRILLLLVLLNFSHVNSSPVVQRSTEPQLTAGVYLIESVKTKSFLSAVGEPSTTAIGVNKVKTLVGGEAPQQRWVIIPVGKGPGKTFLIINEVHHSNAVSTLVIGTHKKLARSWKIKPLSKDEDGPWQLMNMHFETCLSSGSRNGGEVDFDKCSEYVEEQKWNFKLIRKLEAAKR